MTVRWFKAVAAISMVLVACQPAAQVASTSATSPIPTQSAIVTPAPTAAAVATPQPTAPPPSNLEIVRLSRLGSGNDATLNVELKNANLDWGIVRGTFDLTLLDKNDNVVSVAGSGGVPGASCCTLYQIPPGGSYWVPDVASGKDAVNTASVEIRVTGGWVHWPEVEDPPTVEVISPRFKISYGFGTITGRVTVHGAGVFNVIVMGVVEGAGPTFGAGSGVVECVVAGDRVAFSVDLFQVPNDPKLGKVVAYVTTIPGIGSVDSPPGC